MSNFDKGDLVDKGDYYLNPDTGQVFDKKAFNLVLIPTDRSHRPVKEGFFMGFQEAFLILAKDKELSHDARRIFEYMLATLSQGNAILVRQVDVAEDLEIDKQRVSKAIKELVTRKIVLKAAKIGTMNAYQLTLNSYVAYNGKLAGLKKTRESHLKLVWSKERDANTPDLFAKQPETETQKSA